MSKSFPSYKQYDSKDCGPTALKIVAKHYGNYVSVEKLRELAETTRLGTSLQGITNAAEAIGLRTLPAKINLQQLQEAPLPAVLHWNKNHFVVLYKITKTKLYISDPAHGLLTYNRNAFIKSWIGVNANDTTEEGIVLLLEPTPKFYEKRTNEKGENLKNDPDLKGKFDAEI